MMIKHRLLSFMITVPLFNGQKHPVPSRPLCRGPTVIQYFLFISVNMNLNSSGGERDGHSEAEDVGAIGSVELPGDGGSDRWVQRADGESHFVGPHVTGLRRLRVSRGGGDGPRQRDSANGAHHVGGTSRDIFRSFDIERDVRVGSFD